ncbi:MAG: DUF1015 family protein [Planctomycetota bacterium]
MVAIAGLVGLRPAPERAATVTAPPYDVVKRGTPLEQLLQERPESVYHVVLGEDPAAAVARLEATGALIDDPEPCYYVYEQRWDGGSRIGFFAAVAVSDYAQGEIIRHEKTFDDKVQGRIALARATGLNTGPVFLLTRAALAQTCATVMAGAPTYHFTSDFAAATDLHGIENRVWRVPAESVSGTTLAAAVADLPLYIADGHHRYHAALRGGQTHALAYITDGAGILAYNRVINGVQPFAAIAPQLDLQPTERFATPPKHHFALYSGGKSYLLPAQRVPDDVVGRLDCSILERELYPTLGLSHEMIMDPAHFDYYAEYELPTMRARVDADDYDLAVALAPVEIEELMAVADAGLRDPEIVMPEKSTFFAPKILTGLLFYRFATR